MNECVYISLFPKPNDNELLILYFISSTKMNETHGDKTEDSVLTSSASSVIHAVSSLYSYYFNKLVKSIWYSTFVGRLSQSHWWIAHVSFSHFHTSRQCEVFKIILSFIGAAVSPDMSHRLQ